MSRSRTASGSAPATREPEPGSPADLRPRAEQHVQTLARLLPPGEDDAVLAAAGWRRSGIEHAVRDHLVLARQPARPATPCARSETAIRWSIRSMRKPQSGIAATASSRGRRTRGTSRRSGSARRDERREADRRRHRLVQVEHVEALALERAPDPEVRARREHDVRQRAVRRHDHRAPDRDDVRRAARRGARPEGAGRA